MSLETFFFHNSSKVKSCQVTWRFTYFLQCTNTSSLAATIFLGFVKTVESWKLQSFHFSGYFSLKSSAVVSNNCSLLHHHRKRGLSEIVIRCIIEIYRIYEIYKIYNCYIEISLKFQIGSLFTTSKTPHSGNRKGKLTMFSFFLCPEMKGKRTSMLNPLLFSYSSPECMGREVWIEVWEQGTFLYTTAGYGKVSLLPFMSDKM